MHSFLLHFHALDISNHAHYSLTQHLNYIHSLFTHSLVQFLKYTQTQFTRSLTLSMKPYSFELEFVCERWRDMLKIWQTKRTANASNTHTIVTHMKYMDKHLRWRGSNGINEHACPYISYGQQLCVRIG